ncbi:MAG: helix-turn-helix domain-containing protein [Clostridia bacterium]|nr:helix-turn-helix domain-containing protein [Clostridia bacterium]
MPFLNQLYNDNELPNRAKIVYIYLHDRMDSDKKSWPSINRIAEDLSLSRSTVKRAIADLVKAGYIRKETCFRKNGSFTSNRYYLI